MKSTTIQIWKGRFNQLAVAGILAGAVMLAHPARAAAQGFSVRVGVGHPFYGSEIGAFYGPVYGSDRFEERRREEFRRHEEFLRREEFLRHEDFARHEWREREHDRGREFAPDYRFDRR